MEKARLRNLSLLLAILIIVVTIVFMGLVYFRFLRLHILIGEFNIHHWLSWAGVIFISFFTPIYYFLKRRYPKEGRALLATHVFGSLIAVAFVSVHFIQEVTRPPQSFPELGTGIVLYPAMIILVFTGFLMRFQFAKRTYRSWRFLHASVAVTFYLIILVHILHGLEII